MCVALLLLLQLRGWRIRSGELAQVEKQLPGVGLPARELRGRFCSKLKLE